MEENFKNLVLETIDDFKREAKYLEKEKSCTIALDFDGTVVENEWPNIGKENPHCVEILKRWIKDYNVGIVLHTMRDGKLLDNAINWFKERGIELYGLNIHPEQTDWDYTSHKAYAQFCIDDRNVGTPLILTNKSRPVVDWLKIDEIMSPILSELNKR